MASRVCFCSESTTPDYLEDSFLIPHPPPHPQMPPAAPEPRGSARLSACLRVLVAHHTMHTNRFPAVALNLLWIRGSGWIFSIGCFLPLFMNDIFGPCSCWGAMSGLIIMHPSSKKKKKRPYAHPPDSTVRGLVPGSPAQQKKIGAPSPRELAAPHKGEGDL